MTTKITPICTGCHKTPSELPEYVDAAADEGIDPNDYIRTEEGTYNPANGHFLCSPCYVKAGCPTSPYPGWKAP